MNTENFIFKTDSYKHSHWNLYPNNTQKVYSYFESRGGKFKEVVFFGLNYILRKHFEGVQVTKKDIAEAKDIIDKHLGPGVFNVKGWTRILEKHGGRLPLHIRALPEGTIVPNGCVMMTVENTDPECAFLTNFAETLLVQVWYPTTVATNSREMVRTIKNYLEETAPNSDSLLFKMHDFGFRGVSSIEQAALGGAAHLVNSMGTDTMAALVLTAEYYNAQMAGFSIPATEHSIMCSWARKGEFDAVRNMLVQYPEGIIACVSDTYNIFEACKMYAGELKELIMARDGTFVVRPDSGDPVTVVLECLDILTKGYAGDVTMVGKNNAYKLLPPQIRLIQGDGIDIEMLTAILEAMKQNGYSAENIAFGSGGGLLQKVDRDTLRMAFKASHFIIDGKVRNERKDPVTDPGKRSKLGKFKVIDVDGVLTTVDPKTPGVDYLQTVFKNGHVYCEPDFEDIRARAKL